MAGILTFSVTLLLCCGLFGHTVKGTEALTGDIGVKAETVETGDPRSLLQDGERYPVDVREKCVTTRLYADKTLTQAVHVRFDQSAYVNFLLLFADVDDAWNEVREKASVTVDGRLCWSGDMRFEDGRLTVVCIEPLEGQEVIIHLPTRNATLRLCEIEIYDTSCDCLDGCSADDSDLCFAPCVREEGKCTRENVALTGKADSSALVERSGPPSVVINNNTGTTFVSRKDTSDDNSLNCILTEDPSTSTLDALQWWSVELPSPVPVRGVVIYRSNAEEERKTGSVTKITVDGQDCATYGPETLPPEDVLRARIVVACDDVVTGQTVKVYRAESTLPLQLCELQIWTCKQGWYGKDCSQECGQCAGTCHAFTGECSVEGCEAGWYGPLCDMPCSGHCLHSRCEQDSGHCLQCPIHLALPFCTECESGWYGSDCSAECGQCLENTTCSSTTGECVQGCRAGFLPPLCLNATTSPGEKPEGNENAGTIAGVVVGVLLVLIIVFVVVFIWYRRRKRQQDAAGNTLKAAHLPSHTGAKVYTKKEVFQTESSQSHTYTDAMSHAHTTTTNQDHPHASQQNHHRPRRDVSLNSDDHGASDAIYDVVDENPYDKLEERASPYANVKADDQHYYVTPVFTRGQSVQSGESGGYMSMDSDRPADAYVDMGGENTSTYVNALAQKDSTSGYTNVEAI